MKKLRKVSSTIHMCSNIERTLKRTKKGRLTYIDDENGNPMSDTRARIELNRLLAEGHRVIPVSSGCYRFDKVNGCPHHIKSLMPTDEDMEKIEIEWARHITKVA